MAEGFLLAVIFKVKIRRSMAIMIVANYFSTYIGFLARERLIRSYVDSHQITLNDIVPLFTVLISIVVVLTILLEWPFCVWILRGRKLSCRHAAASSLLASVVLQLASYSLVIPWYISSMGNWQILPKFHVIPAHTLAHSSAVTMYYASLDDGHIISSKLDGSGRRDFTEIRIHPNEELRLRLSGNLNYADLWATHSYTTNDNDIAYKSRLLSTRVGLIPRNKNNLLLGKDISALPDITIGSSYGWIISHNVAERRHKLRKTDRVFYSFEIPWISWGSYNPSLLPGPQILYQLGPNQIVLADLNKHKICLLTLGRSPVAVLEDGRLSSEK
jgi:hypothetical protein